MALSCGWRGLFEFWHYGLFDTNCRTLKTEPVCVVSRALCPPHACCFSSLVVIGSFVPMLSGSLSDLFLFLNWIFICLPQRFCTFATSILFTQCAKQTFIALKNVFFKFVAVIGFVFCLLRRLGESVVWFGLLALFSLSSYFFHRCTSCLVKKNLVTYRHNMPRTE